MHSLKKTRIKECGQEWMRLPRRSAPRNRQEGEAFVMTGERNTPRKGGEETPCDDERRNTPHRGKKMRKTPVMTIIKRGCLFYLGI